MAIRGKTMKKIKKRNHYLPRFYLKGFCDSNSRVWMYDKTDPMQPIDGAPGDMALVKKLYHLEESAYAKDEIEDYFEKAIETPASRSFKKLLTKEFPDEKDKETLSIFFATLMVRTPIYINHINMQQSKEFDVVAKAGASNQEHFYRVYKRIHPELNDLAIEEDRLAILNNEIKFKAHSDFTLATMLILGLNIAPLLQRMKWVLIETTNDLPFITSDNFMSVSNPKYTSGLYSSGLGMPDTRVYFTISKSLMLLMVNNNDFNEKVVYDINNPSTLNGKKINLKEFVKVINKKIYCECSKYVFTSSNDVKMKRCFDNLLREAKIAEECLQKNVK